MTTHADDLHEREECFGPSREPRVFCPKCEEWKADKETEFVNIEENIFGEDNYTFICKKCGEENTSLVVAI